LKAAAGMSPAPSVSRSDITSASPSLPAGSCTAPPTNAYRMAIKGTLCSSTSQALIPFRLTISSTVSAAAGSTIAPTSTHASASTLPARRRGHGWRNSLSIRKALSCQSSFRCHGPRCGRGLACRCRRRQRSRNGTFGHEVLCGRTLDVVWAPRLDRCRHAIDVGHRPPQRNAFAIAARQRHLIVGVEDAPRLERRLGALQLVLRYTLLAHLGDRGIERRLHLLERNAGQRQRHEGHPAAVEPVADVVRPGRRGQVLRHQPLVEPGCVIAADDAGEERQALRLAGPCG